MGGVRAAPQTERGGLESLAAESILAVGVDRPEDLFGRDPSCLVARYHALARRWHPDTCDDPRATEVFQHVSELRASGERRIQDGSWREPGTFSCALAGGKTLRVSSDASGDFELGQWHVSATTLTYSVRREFSDLFDNGIRAARTLKFGSDKMRDACQACLPTTLVTYEAASGDRIATIRKLPDAVRLRDLIPHLTDKRDRHAAWITSRLHELARYLEYAGVTHCGITAENVLVSPSQHSACLLGGWWYATPFGERVTAAPSEAVALMRAPHTMNYDGAIARAMTRSLALEVLGDRAGSRLTAARAAPQGIIDFLRSPSTGDAQADLSGWHRVLDHAFGPRRFVELSVGYRDVYPSRSIAIGEV